MKMQYSISNLVNTYKTLEKWPVPIDQEFSIYAYFLFSEPKDGKYGKQIFLGAYPTKVRAFQEIEKIIRKTGHDAIYMSETCSWQDIDSKKNHDRTFNLDTKTKSEELQQQFIRDITEKEKKRQKQEEIMKELDEQQEKELDPTTIEHYAHNWFNAIKNKASYEYHKKQMSLYESAYEQRKDKIREQYEKQPEFEREWLNIYEERLKRRNEEPIFMMLVEGHDNLKEEIFNKNK